MSLHKYHGELGGPAHGGRLHWPGTLDGFPVLGQAGAPVNLKQDELENNVDLRKDFKSRMFLLWDEKDKADFDDINDKIVNGWYLLLKRADVYDEQQKHYRVWIEWAQVYGMIPPGH